MNISLINQRKSSLQLTNQRLAQMTGVTLSTLDKITSGVNTNPKLDTLCALATALECTLDELANRAPTDGCSEEARKIAHNYDTLDPRGQRLIRCCMDAELAELHNPDPIFNPAANYAEAVQAVTAALQPEDASDDAKAHA